ncbi:MAG: glycosyltransferase family 4 protein [Candidatus Sericytochromatia bacterium]|nr:glycosyltransferase family 4 protein [Candidatus Sericytochromatia bacterium]
MRIGMLAPVWEATPPQAYGGIELVVALLVDGLVARGHHVTLYATGNSACGGRLLATEAEPLRAQHLDAWSQQAAEIRHVERAMRDAGALELVHNHAGFLGVAFSALAGVRALTTLHGPVPPRHVPYYGTYTEHAYVAISEAQRQAAVGLEVCATIHHGIDTARFAPGGAKQDYLLFLGRVSPEKGTHLAIEAARRAGLPLVIAAKIDPEDRAYFEGQIAPRVDGTHVRFVGEVQGAAKLEVLRGARALLHLVQFPEPFGLVMIEALACGTPVVALPHGSIPEVVAHGRTGYVVRDLDEAVAALARLDALSPSACRAEAVSRFDAGVMVERYCALYASLCAPCVSIRRRRGAGSA